MHFLMDGSYTVEKNGIIAEIRSSETLNLNRIIYFYDFSGIMPTVPKIFLNPVQNLNETHISERTNVFRVILQGISDMTKHFHIFSLITERTY